MKYEKTLAVLAGLTFAGSLAQAQIAVGDNLTVSGFADASYSQTSTTVAKTSDFGIDQVEVDLDFSFEAVTASVHLESKGGDLSHSNKLSQALILAGVTVRRSYAQPSRF